MSDTALTIAGPSKLQIDRGPELGQRPPPTLQSVRFDFLDRYGRHPGYGLTIQRILHIFREAEYGYPALQCDLFDDVIERDAHLRSQIEMRLCAVAGKQWILQPGGDADEDIEAAVELEQRLRRVPDMRETFEHLLTAPAYGWAASEILWDDVDGLFAPVWFENVPHRRFIFDAQGRPRLLTASAPSDGVPLEPGRWLFTAGRHRSIPMSGLMRTAVFWSLFKSKAAADWVLTNERYGVPMPIGTYGDATPKEEKTALVEALGKIGQDFLAAFHESCKITGLDMGSRAGTPDQVHGMLIALVNAEISKLFTGGTLTSGEGTSAGSYAQASVHENRLFDFTVGDAERIPQIFEHQLATPFVVWNNLPGKPPKLKIHIVRDMNPVERMNIFTMAQKLGMALDADQVRQEMQIKPPTGEVLDPPTVPEPSAMPGNGQ
jgi:phage gp29-like protein